MRRRGVALSFCVPVALLGAWLTGSAAASLPQCRTGQLAARTTGSEAGLGHGGFVLVLTNRSSAPCRTGGYVGLLRLDTDHRPLPTAVHRGSGYLFEGPKPRTLVVGAGRSVSAGVEWFDASAPSDPADCDVAGHYLEVTPPNERTHLTITAPTADCGAGYISTTALQAGTKGPRS